MLHLDHNNFNHSILQSLSGIASLKELYLSGNNLNGSIHINGKTLINLQRNIIGRVFHARLLSMSHFLFPSYQSLIFMQLNFTLFFLSYFKWKVFMQLKFLFFLMIFYVNFFIVEFKAFSNLEELYLRRNNIHDFVTTKGI